MTGRVDTAVLGVEGAPYPSRISFAWNVTTPPGSGTWFVPVSRP